MPEDLFNALSRRERQILQALYRNGPSSIQDIRSELPDAPSAGAVRTLVRGLIRERLVRVRSDGVRNIYAPVLDQRTAGRKAIAHLVQTFFDGSVRRAAAALFDEDELARMSEEEIARCRALLEPESPEGTSRPRDGGPSDGIE